MSERMFALPSGGVYSLTDATVAALLNTGSGAAARVYLYLLRQNGRCDDRPLCADLGLSREALSEALSLLQKAGLLSEALGQAVHVDSDVRPDYSGKEVARGLEEHPAFRHVAEETQRRLGRVLSSSDLQILFGLYDWRGFSPGVISLLISHCLEDAARRWGPGRMPTLRQIDKQAALWEQEGIDSEERAEQYIQTRESARQSTSVVYRALGIAGRGPSASEEKYVSDWIAMGFVPDVIALAYDKTALKTGGLNWKYMHSILKSWKEKNLLTLDAIETGDARHPQTPSRANPGSAAAPAARDRQATEKMKRFVAE
ncbi:MAG: DnaD domain protein [Oscillospiraceae bacterium]|jgi:DnaD/phage-associated family protein|nr:DnaD domain protein [Oscillospiraceae bacterium]